MRETVHQASAVSDWSGARTSIAGALARRPGVVLAILWVLLAVLAALWPTVFTNADPAQVNSDAILAPPSLTHLFGTDQLGRDMLARIAHGAGLTLMAAGVALAVALSIGVLAGAVAGFVGGITDTIIMRIVDVTLAIPGLLLALMIITSIGYGTVPVALAVGIGLLPGFARTTRAEVLRVRNAPYVEAAMLCGQRPSTILFAHVLPNSAGPVVALAVLDFGRAILWVAALSFLGFGAQPPLADWGSLISDGRAALVNAPWVPLIPGLVVGLSVFSLNHIARTLEEVRP
ncbi:MAG: ABC transporter permease [Leucobacter sp.]